MQKGGILLALYRVYLIVMHIGALVWQGFFLQVSNNKETTQKSLLVSFLVPWFLTGRLIFPPINYSFLTQLKATFIFTYLFAVRILNCNVITIIYTSFTLLGWHHMVSTIQGGQGAQQRTRNYVWEGQLATPPLSLPIQWQSCGTIQEVGVISEQPQFIATAFKTGTHFQDSATQPLCRKALQQKGCFLKDIY